MTDSIGTIAGARRVWWALRTTRPPRPSGSGSVDHSALQPVLDAAANGGVGALPTVESQLSDYLQEMTTIEPDQLSQPEALAYWVNLYNGYALSLAARTHRAGQPSVLRDPLEFKGAIAVISGERLSLDDIEHGKVRRMRDPRIHGALVCGSVSCPTLRATPFQGTAIDAQFEDQMRAFVSAGAAEADPKRNRLSLSRIFYWYGADFVRPHRMPAWIPARRGDLLQAIKQWLPPETGQWIESNRPSVSFQRYDFGLACSVG